MPSAKSGAQDGVLSLSWGFSFVQLYGFTQKNRHIHHSDRGIQYASGEYVTILRKHEMVPSMSRPANPYDNASCESFIKTLKREEIYTNEYQDLDHLRSNIEEFIERYYNQKRLHSALGYRSPEE